MYKKITFILFCCLIITYAYSQKQVLSGVINPPKPGKFEIIPYTSPNYEVQNKNIQNKINLKSAKAQLIDSLIIEGIIPENSSYAVKYNYRSDSIALKQIPPSVILTDSALMAIACSPKWLQTDLWDNLRKLSADLQNKYAKCIITSDTLYRDEVAFQIAHLSPNYTLYITVPDLFVINAQGIYQLAPDLQYVKLVEHGSAKSGDWYTTTSYRVIDAQGDTVWREIPRDIYYWWIVEPVIFEVAPIMDSTVYNEFWRTYVYTHADSAYPVLKNVLAGIKVFWDGKESYWNNAGAPFNDSLSAVQAIGRWVAQTIPWDAMNPRPIQPNQILHWHHGNCGEIQVLQSAGARAGLIPVVPLASWPGDHTWDEVYWPDSAKWAFYQVNADSGPTTVSWNQTWLANKGCITAWRADGYRYMVNEHYQPVCTFTVVVRDNTGKPVDGAEIFFAAADQSDPTGLNYVIGTWGHTDENGELTVLLGTNINYAIRADWENGHIPVNAMSLNAISYLNLPEGGHYWMYLNAGGYMPKETPHNAVNDTSFYKYSIVVEDSVPYHTVYGQKYWQNQNFWQDMLAYANKIDGGKISTFICDSANYQAFSKNSMFNAYRYIDTLNSGWMGLDMPGSKDFYIGFSNKMRLNTSKYAKMKVYLYNGAASVNEIKPNDNNLLVYPNPSQGIFNILTTKNVNADIEILNTFGQSVYKTYFNNTASRKTIDLSSYPKGIYLLEIHNNQTTEVRKLVVQ